MEKQIEAKNFQPTAGANRPEIRPLAQLSVI